LSSNIIDYVRAGSKGTRQDINKILAELQDLNAEDPEDAALQERIALWDSKRLKTSSLQVAGPANQISNAGPRQRRTEEYTYEVPTTCDSWPYAPVSNGTFTFPNKELETIFGGGAGFGGTNEYVSIPNVVATDLNFEHTDAFSIACFFRATTPVTVIPSIVTKSVGFGTEIGWKFYTGSTGRLAFKLADGTNQFFVSVSTPEVDDGLWNSCVATFSGNSNQNGMKLYINKTLEVTGGASAISSTIVNTEATGIGATGAGANKLDGQLAHVIVIKEEVTQAWIDAYHGALVNGTRAGHFDFSGGNLVFFAPFVGDTIVLGEGVSGFCAT